MVALASDGLPENLTCAFFDPQPWFRVPFRSLSLYGLLAFPNSSSVDMMMRDSKDFEGLIVRIPEENKWCTQKGFNRKEFNRETLQWVVEGKRTSMGW